MTAIDVQNAQDVQKLIQKLFEQLSLLIKNEKLDNPLMVGIHTGGVWIAEKLHAMLDIQAPLGVLDISFYRDDFTRVGINPQVKPSRLPNTTDDRNILLIDDVLYTGRTIRAALNELFDYGRPAKVILAVLIDRGGRELPFQANVIGQQLTLSEKEQVKLTGPDPLLCEIQKV